MRRLFGAVCALLVHQSSAACTYVDTDINVTEWKHALYLANSLVRKAQTAHRQLLYLVDSINVTGTAADLTSTITDLEDTITKNFEGSAELSIPCVNPVNEWADKNTYMLRFQDWVKELNDAKDPPDKADTGHYDAVMAAYDAWYPYIKDFIELWEDQVQASGEAVERVQIRTVTRQAYLIEELMIFVMKVKLGMDAEAALVNMASDEELYTESHAGLLYGLEFVGLSSTDDMCTLQYMGRVYDLWLPFKDHLAEILSLRTVSEVLRDVMVLEFPGLIAATGQAVMSYVLPVPSCMEEIPENEWLMLIETSTVGMMYAQKVGRLFLQAASEINLLDSRVLISDSLVAASARLQWLLSGSQLREVPAPVTQDVANNYTTMLDMWSKFQVLLADNVQTVTQADRALIENVERSSEEFYNQAVIALDAVLVECRERLLDQQKCDSMMVAGRLRVLLQKASKEACLQNVEQNKEQNRLKMLETAHLFEDSMEMMLHGKVVSSTRALDYQLMRVEDVCIMRQFKHIQDQWFDFIALVESVSAGNTDDDTTLALDGLQWSAGVDPRFAQITKVMRGGYNMGTADCSSLPPLTREEFETAIRGLGEARIALRAYAKGFFYKELFATSGDEDVEVLFARFDPMLYRLTSGWLLEGYPAPPDQVILDALRLAIDGEVPTESWDSIKEWLDNPDTDLAYFATRVTDLDARIAAAIDSYVTVAYAQNQDVPGARSKLVTETRMLVDRMCEVSAWIDIPIAEAVPTLNSVKSQFIDNLDVLRNGNNLEGADHIPETTIDEDKHLACLEEVDAAWVNVEKKISPFGAGVLPSKGELEETASFAFRLNRALDACIVWYSRMTVIVERTKVDIMMPIPLTGTWTGGQTMRLASTIAQDMINDEQILLPGYTVQLAFVDDGCDPDAANRKMLENYASSDAWVGIGGLGCSSVCESLSVITASLFLPTVSFECSEGEALSDQSLFPDFIRLGTPRAAMVSIVKDVLTMDDFWWTDEVLTVVSTGNAIDMARAENTMKELSAQNIPVEAQSLAEEDWNAFMTSMTLWKEEKRRMFFVVGNEQFFRRLLCAASEVNIPPGLMWISEGIVSRSWWTKDDQSLMAIVPGCDGNRIEQLYTNALSVTGLGRPVESSDEKLECFPTYTSDELYDYVKGLIVDGYISSDDVSYNVTRPHDQLINFAIDGVCIFVKMVQSMLASGRTIEELRTPEEGVYREAITYLKNSMSFRGASGQVSINGNDLPGELAVWQMAIPEAGEPQIGSYLKRAGTVLVDSTRSYPDLHKASWTQAPKDSLIDMTDEDWINVLDVSSEFLMFGSKVVRLFLQAALKVNTLDSRVLFSDSRVGIQRMLNVLTAGDGAAGVPDSWTQGVDRLIEAFENINIKWAAFSRILADNIGTVDNTPEFVDLIADVTQRSEEFSSLSEAVTDLIVDECYERRAGVNCRGLILLGRQRYLLQRLSKTGVLIGLGIDVADNEARMLADVKLFETNHGNLVLGTGVNLSRIEDHCTLEQMKKLRDHFIPFAQSAKQVYTGNATNDNILKLDKAQWSAGVDPLFELVTQALNSYQTGVGTCIHEELSREQLEAALKEIGNIVDLLQRVSADHLMISKDIEVPSAKDNLENLQTRLNRLITGWKPQTPGMVEIPSPPTAELATMYFQILDGDEGLNNGWFAFKDTLENTVLGDQGAVDTILDIGSNVVGKVGLLWNQYVEEVYFMNPIVPGARSRLAGQQFSQLENMVKLSAGVTLGRDTDGLRSAISQFENNQNILRQGSLAEDDDWNTIEPAEDASILIVLDRVDEEWRRFKPNVQNLAKNPSASTAVLNSINSERMALRDALEDAYDELSTFTQTTTKTPVKIMVPLPFSGAWTPGATMRIAALVAEDLINKRQEMLPGKRIMTDFFDDGCDPDMANRAMLEKFASSSDWIGVGGMGCSSVCESLAVITSSLFLPAVSFECSDGDDLSDSDLFPNFIRFGTRRTWLPKVLTSLRDNAKMTWWDMITIISGNSPDEQAAAEAMKAKFAERGLVSIIRTSARADAKASANWETTKSLMRSVKANKERIMFFMGGEKFFRQVLCATKEVDSAIAGTEETVLSGLTWVSEGSKQNEWWMVDDPILTALSGSCTGEALLEYYQGGLNIVGHGKSQEQTDLKCFPGKKPEDLHQMVLDTLAANTWQEDPEQDPTGKYVVGRPYEDVINFVVDGICSFAVLVQTMLEKHPMDELRTPDEGVYREAVRFLKEEMAFDGVTGWVNVSTNDLPGSVALIQILNGKPEIVGTISPDGVMEANIRFDEWSAAPEDPEVPMDARNWQAVLDIATVQLMYSEKLPRLFGQASINVNQADSRVLFSDSRVGAGARLEELLEGTSDGTKEQGPRLPAKWYKEGVKELLDRQHAQFSTTEVVLAENVQTVDKDDAKLLSEIDEQCQFMFSLGMQALELSVQDCLRREPELGCETLKVLGLQRVLLQRIAKESVWQAAGIDYESHKANMSAAVQTYAENMYALVHGRPPLIRKTRDHCMLQQLKKVQDEWNAFSVNAHKILEMEEGEVDPDVVMALDGAMWKAGVDPMFATLSAALKSFEAGQGTCVQVGEKNATQEQLEAAIASIATLRTMNEKMVTDFVLVATSADDGPSDRLAESIASFDESLKRLISGWQDMLPAPTAQSVADSLYQVDEGSRESKGWSDMKALMQADPLSDFRAVDAYSMDVAVYLESAINAYILSAWEINEEVPGARSKLANEQTMLMQRMLKEARLLALDVPSVDERLQTSMTRFEQNLKRLQRGAKGGDVGSRRLNGAMDIIATTEDAHQDALDTMTAGWLKLKPMLETVLDGDTSFTALENVTNATVELDRRMQETRTLFSTKTIITTKTPVDIMIPLPLTGQFAPGPTMMRTAMIARDIINDQQLMLPGYEVLTRFFDDACDAATANRGMLEMYASTGAWIGIGGMACSTVCQSLGVIASSLYLPVLSFECSAGEELADQELFPDFNRLTSFRTQVPSILEHLRNQFDWGEIFIVTADVQLFRGPATTTFTSLQELEMRSTMEAIDASDWEAAMGVMARVFRNKIRTILMYGTEDFYRMLICASHATGVKAGLTWLTEGPQSRNWWTVEDTTLTEYNLECTGAKITELYSGALNMVGLAEPLQDMQDEPTECYDGYTAQTLTQHVQDLIAIGYPEDESSNETIVERPHDRVISLTLDGICAFTKYVRFFTMERAQKLDIEELRTPTLPVYRMVTEHIKTKLTFRGASGLVDVEGNDNPNHLGVWQVIGNETRNVGVATTDGQINVSYEFGLVNTSWAEAAADAAAKVEEGFPVLFVVIPVLVIFFCSVIGYAAYTGRKATAQRSVNLT